MIVINFKNYVYGKEAIILAKKIEKFLPKAIVCPNFLDLEVIKEKTKLKVYSQHLDYFKKEKTGFVFPGNLKRVGINGSLLNHSEHRLKIREIQKTLFDSKGLEIIVCVSSVREAKKILKLSREIYGIAFEDPKLIGSGKSVIEYNPKELIKFIDLVKKSKRKVKILCGAGISSREDYVKSRELGCDGVLISSAIANNKNPDKLLKSLRG